ncbi:hypothetical protein FRC09_006757 [Ceratobasidium sp. 395]|nr:hypothetical protein FRC09_006757 [Ceratobasidium sp. 395]
MPLPATPPPLCFDPHTPQFEPSRGKRLRPDDFQDFQKSSKRARVLTTAHASTSHHRAAPTIIPNPVPKPPRPWIHQRLHTDPTAGGVLRWEPVEDEIRPLYDRKWEDIRVFEKANWLGNVHVSDADRDEFFKQDVSVQITLLGGDELTVTQQNPGIPWKNVREFNTNVDQLPHGPGWSTILVPRPDGVLADVPARDPLEIIQQLISTRRFAWCMRYAPVQWTSEPGGKRLYGEMHTANWWWRVQTMLGLGRGATVIAIIISSDKTHLSEMSGNKQAWPVYISIGNISKDLRRKPSQQGMMLLGYVPVTGLTGEEGWQFYHDCVAAMLRPLREAGTNGVEMKCADGGVRLCFPILAAFIGDWQDQTLVACSLDNRCPVCPVPSAERGDGPNQYKVRSNEERHAARAAYDAGQRDALSDNGLRPTKPFWRKLPYVNISDSIAPDLLHQLHKGVFGAHINTWLTKLIKEPRFDAWMMGMPRSSGLRHFTHGKTCISRWTGEESKALAQVFMSVAAGCDEAKAIRAARHIVDFMYRAHLPLLSEDDLQELEKDLLGFHDLKDIFVQSGAYPTKHGFIKMAKIHMLSHYVRAIRELGSPDNFNTEATERLHIEYVKNGWRASNHVNELPQMAKYLQRRESWVLLRTHLSSIGVLPSNDKPDSLEPILDEDSGPQEELRGNSGAKDGGIFETVKQAASVGSAEVVQEWTDNLVWHPKPLVSTASDATHVKHSGDYLIRTHGAEHLLEATQDFLLSHTGSRSRRPLNEKDTFMVWPRCRLEHGCLPFVPTDLAVTQTIRAMPTAYDAFDRVSRYPTFDTALFVAKPEAQGLKSEFLYFSQ